MNKLSENPGSLLMAEGGIMPNDAFKFSDVKGATFGTTSFNFSLRLRLRETKQNKTFHTKNFNWSVLQQ